VDKIRKLKRITEKTKLVGARRKMENSRISSQAIFGEN